MKTKPLVSVIVPVYNVEAYLERCITSIINQTYKNLEIIIVNDGSTDSSGEICEKFNSLSENIKVIHQENKGQSVARNKGLDICNGDFIVFVDSDDWLKEEMISKTLNFALKHQLQIVECGMLESKNLKNEENTSLETIIETKNEAMLRILKTTYYSVWRRIYARELIKEMRFLPDRISEDVYFTLDCITKIKFHGYIAEKLYIYNTENISTTRSPYTLAKLETKNTLDYIVLKTINFSESVKNEAAKVKLEGLIEHLNKFMLSGIEDKKKQTSKALKRQVSQQYTKIKKTVILSKKTQITVRMIRTFPLFFWRLLLKANNVRIALKYLIIK